MNDLNLKPAAAALALCAAFVLLPAPSAALLGSTPTSSNTEYVTIVDYDYDPPYLVVAAGTQVVWTNTGAGPHQVAAHINDPASLPTGTEDFEATISSGASWSTTFASTGVFMVNCNLGGDHDTMKMLIVVT